MFAPETAGAQEKALLKRPDWGRPGANGSGPQAQCGGRLPPPRPGGRGQHQLLGPPGQRRTPGWPKPGARQNPSGGAVSGPPGTAVTTSPETWASGLATGRSPQLSRPFSGRSRSESPTQGSPSGSRGAALPEGRRLGPPLPLPLPCRRSQSGGSRRGSEGTGGWRCGPPAGPPCPTEGSRGRTKG